MTDHAPTRAFCQDPDIANVAQWLAAHDRDVDEAAWWRVYLATSDPGERLRLLQVRLDRRPGDPLLPRHDPSITKATLTVAYLRGQWSAPDLDPVSRQWSWREICQYAETQGAGWDSYQEPDSARGAFRVLAGRGHLEIPPAPPDTYERIIGFLSGLAAVKQNCVGVSRTG